MYTQQGPVMQLKQSHLQQDPVVQYKQTVHQSRKGEYTTAWAAESSSIEELRN